MALNTSRSPRESPFLLFKVPVIVKVSNWLGTCEMLELTSDWRKTEYWLMVINLQRATMSMERDENYVPRMRSDYKLPPQGQAQPIDYEEIFEEMPLFTLGRMVLMQLLGMQSYLLRNSMGLPSYPPGTNVWPIAFFLLHLTISQPQQAFLPFITAV